MDESQLPQRSPSDAGDTYLHVLNELPSLIWRSGIDARCDFFNQSWLRFTGRTMEQEIGEGWTEGVHPDDYDRVINTYIQSFEKHQPFSMEYRLRHFTGEYRWVLDIGRPLHDSQGNFSGYIGNCFDLTERKRMEQALAESEAMFKGLFDFSPDGVIAVDHQGRIMLANRQALEMFGYETGEMTGLFVQHLLPSYLHARHREHIREFIKNPRLRPMGAESNLVACRKNGSQFPVDITLGPLFVGDLRLVLATIRDITERKLAESELRQHREHLEEMVAARTKALEAEIAERSRAEAQVRRQEAALKSYAARLMRSNRDLEDFASIASHDLQEPLRKVTAFGARLQKKSHEQLDPESQDYLDRMIDAARRMQNMLDALLTYSRLTTSAQEHQALDLNQLIDEVLEDLELQLEESGGRVEVGQLPVVEAEPTQMRQLFQNLISNGLKFHQPGTSPHVTIRAQTLPDETGQTVRLQVSDNGIGIDPQYQEVIFQPFQRLHGRSQYPGAGMGLAICRKIIERHNGTIEIESQPGEGSTFIITLPTSRKTD